MNEYLFIEPIDVLYLRGNRLFGDPGAHGEALMPPWPSLPAGAIRSRMLADSGTDLAAFARSQAVPEGRLGVCIGTPDQPGTFCIKCFSLGYKKQDGTVKPYIPLPNDLIADKTNINYLRPCQFHPDLALSCELPLVPVLCRDKPEKPQEGFWLNYDGIAAYLAGDPLTFDHTCNQKDLWKNDPRLGIALDPATRTAAEGRIYTTETVALKKGTGFLVSVGGVEDCLPEGGLLRFGGDGRGAEVSLCRVSYPEPPWERIAAEKKFRLVLSTPGIFDHGWRLPGLSQENDKLILHAGKFTARFVSATVNRFEVVSGWDLARKRPKTAQRVVPVGSVYWFDQFDGDIDGLKSLVDKGLWSLIDQHDPARLAEGYNNVFVAAWPLD